ncbi:MAG: GNAT family N-acetyltransferase [Beijerinckiaceae bacterium]|jgi:putative acetyltransferase|nr:GNAT family N-acetyltransferase [Beijerinckiaceae bacterium]
MAFEIRPGDFSDPRVIALLEHHYAENRAVSPPESCHVLDYSAMQVPEITFFTLWEGETLLGMGALKQMDAEEGEVKAMRTIPEAKRRGVASAVVMRVISEAKALGLKRLYLETGSFEYFRPARELYLRHGFRECPPFAGYASDPNSTFMMLDLG